MRRATSGLLLLLCALSAACAGTWSGVRPKRGDGKRGSTAAYLVEKCEPPSVAHYNSYFCCADVVGMYAPRTVEAAVELLKRELLHNSDPIRVVGNLHTANEAICSRGVVVRTNHLKRIVGLEEVAGEQTVVVEAGVTIGELNRWLHDRGWSLGAGTLEFRDATVAGAVATGAHGSSPGESSVISSRVRGVWVITPREVSLVGERYAGPNEVRRGATLEDEWRVLTGNLGMAGFVTQLRLKVDRDFGLRVQVDFIDDEWLWTKGGVERVMAGCDWGQVLWFPRAGQMARLCGRRTVELHHVGARNTLLNPSTNSLTVASFKLILNNMAATKGAICMGEQLRLLQLAAAPPQQRRVRGWGDTSLSEVTGPAFEMMSSDLTEVQTSIPQNDFEIAIPMARAAEAIEEAKRYANKKNLCLPFVGVFLRFSTADPNTLALHSSADHQQFSAGKGIVFFEFVVYRPAGRIASHTDEYFAPYLGLAELLIEKYGGRPHWAKNQLSLFQKALATNPDHAARLTRFRDVIKRLDPQRRFSNDFSDAVGLSRPPRTVDIDPDPIAAPPPAPVAAPPPPAAAP